MAKTAEQLGDYNKYLRKEPSGGGRPKLVLSEEGKQMVEILAGYMCTDEEIAATLNTSVALLHNKNNEETFVECKQKGQHKGKVSLRRYQMALAQKNASMAIWLGKQMLGQKDYPEGTTDKGATIVWDV